MDPSQSMSTSEMDRSPQFVSVLPPPPSGIYGQSDSTTNETFAMQKGSIPYLRHNLNHAFMQGPGHNSFPGMACRSGSVSSVANGETVPFALGSGSYQPEQSSTGIAEQPSLTSPQTAFAFAISSPKRQGGVQSGQSAKHGRTGSSKRQRLDLSISTDPSYSQTRNQQGLTTTGQQQYQCYQFPQFGSATMPYGNSMNPPSSADSQYQADMSMSDGNISCSRSSSMAMAGNQSILENNHHSASTFHITQSQQLSPGSVGNGDAQSVPGPRRNNSVTQMPSQGAMQIPSYASATSPSTAGMPVNGFYLGQGGFNSAYSMMQPIPAPILSNGPPTKRSLHPDMNAMFTLVMRQQPERARLCSFKEENDTTILVAPHPEFVMKPSEFSPNRKHGQIYQELRLPAGQEATTGEATQTPEKLQDLEGKEGAFCVFGRLSIRMPGQFRLRFVLYETTQFGIQELGFVISDTFEVFSPKLFGGMRQSTTLTRHFATQGLKIKLRQDGTSRSGRRKKAQPMELDEKATNASEDVVPINDRHENRKSLSRPQHDDNLVSPRDTLVISGPGTQLSDAALPQRALSSIPATAVDFNPVYWAGDGSSTAHYPISSYDSQNAPSLVPAIRSFPSQRLSIPNGYVQHQLTGLQALSSLKTEIQPNYTSEQTLSTIEHALDSSPNDKRSGGSASSAPDVDLASTPLDSTPESTASSKSKTTLPSIGRAMQESSIWFNKAGLVPPDEMVPGGIVFRNGIRYGGDDGFMPPMSFGRLPGLIYDGKLPSTPGASTGTDLSNFSLKNRLANPSSSPYPIVNNSTPPLPGIPLKDGLIQYLNNSTFAGSALSRAETSNGAGSSTRSDKDQSANQRKPSNGSDALIKPSQFADWGEKSDAAAMVHGVEGFSAALSSSLESKVRSFNLALPRRISRGSKASSDESMRDASGEDQHS
ncbi:hypothetical protein QFC21_005954 [Naganishia friedmannii]|uniref:Uncharacterized protein n=1 Tax=Naganishia friedmannii TaxID=89922 RepID=A0ACC2V5N2_9TREE|nr:hypothetical protein QFC21_005954 [Naganishia friedmannii]